MKRGRPYGVDPSCAPAQYACFKNIVAHVYIIIYKMYHAVAACRGGLFESCRSSSVETHLVIIGTLVFPGQKQKPWNLQPEPGQHVDAVSVNATLWLFIYVYKA